MNSLAVVLLSFVLFDFLLNLVADGLNLGVLREDLPEEFRGVYDPQRYRASQAYLRENTRFGWLAGSVSFGAMLCFWFLKGFVLVDHWARGLGQGPILTGLVYIGALLLARGVIALPFDIYQTFGIEERYGFNRTPPATFALDLLKGLCLSVLLGAPLLAGILAFFQYAGADAWWICWMAVSLFMLGVQYVAPTWILPMFNTFRPLEAGELREAIFAYAQSIRFSLENIFVMDGSKRSSKSNAFFTGFGRRKRIVLFDTLIQRHTVSELVAVLAHEMGHYKKRHVLQMTLIGMAQTGILFLLLSFFVSYPGLFEAFYMKEQSVYAGMVFFGMLFSPMELFIGIFLKMLSRKNELGADRFAVKTTGKPGALSDALKKLSVNNLSNLAPHPLYVFLNYSHPPVLERIRAIEGSIPAPVGS